MGAPDQLWAPWRSPYITGMPRGRRRCIFCAAKASRDDESAQVVYRGRRVFSLLNRYPYNNGHLMVACYRHIGTLTRLQPAEASELWQVTTRMVELLSSVLQPDGFNLGLNLGRVAGAGIPGHLHLHIVPRWNGDTNFMPVAAATKVIPESLEALYHRLKPRAARRLR